MLRDPNPTNNAQIAYEIASLIRCFAPQLGAKQERNICDAYQRLDAPDFPALAMELEQSGANGVDLAIVQKMDRFNLFASAQTGVSPEEWLRLSLVIDFKEFGNDNDTKSLAVTLILNFLMKRLNKNLAVKNGTQPLKMVLFVDEAHLLLPKEGKAVPGASPSGWPRKTPRRSSPPAAMPPTSPNWRVAACISRRKHARIRWPITASTPHRGAYPLGESVGQ